MKNKTVLMLSGFLIAALTASVSPVFATLPSSFTATTFPVLGTSLSHGVAVDSNGIVWWTDISSPGAIVKQDPAAGPGAGFTVYPLPSQHFGPITDQVDSAGKIWFGTEDNFIGRFDPVATSFTFFGPIPQSACFPDQLALDLVGNIWFDCLGASHIGKLNPTSGMFSMFVTPTPSSGPSGITVDFTGMVWSIERFGNNVVKLDPSLAVPGTSMGITEFPIPPPLTAPETVKICGNKVWFTGINNFFGGGFPGTGAQIGFLNKVTSTITEFTVDPPFPGFTYGLVLDGNGNPWTTNPGFPKIYGFDTSTNTPGIFSTPTTPHHITLSPTTGDLWYSDLGGEVVRLTPSLPLPKPCNPLAPPKGIVSKTFTQLSPAPSGTFVPLNTQITWRVDYVVADIFSTPITSVVLKDHFAASLAVDTTTITFSAPAGSGAVQPSFTTSTGQQAQWSFVWSIGTLQPGQTATLSVQVHTRINPAGQQEFTLPGLQVLNTGATLKWIPPSLEMQSFTTLPVTVIAGNTVGAVEGVVSSLGTAVQGVNVNLFSGTTMISSVSTSSVGFYHFDSVAPGTYTVSATTTTGTTTITVIVTAGIITTQNLST